MKELSLLLIIFFLGCFSPETKMEIIETDRKILENTYEYSPESSDIDIRFEVSGNDLVGKLYRKEKITYNVSKKEIKDFAYDANGNLKDNYWGMNLLACLATACLHLPFTIYAYVAESLSLGEKRKFEEKEIKKKDFEEFNPDLFQSEIYSIEVNENNKIKIKDSVFTVPLDHFIKRKDENIEYKIMYKNNEVKIATVSFEESNITGTSPKFKKLLAVIEREKKKREIAEEKEREQADKMQSCAELQVGWESYYLNSSPSDYLTICNYSCERSCKDSYNIGTANFKICRTDCKKNCKACFK